MTEIGNTWELIQEGFKPEEALAWEGLFTQGSGYIHVRGSMEEKLEDSPQNIQYLREAVNVSVEKFVDQRTKWGTYIPGMYSPHPLFSGEITNMPFCLGIDLYVDGERLDTVTSKIDGFKRTLDLKTALLTRSMIWKTKSGICLGLEYRRFADEVNKKLILQQVAITPDRDTILKVTAGLDADVRTNGHDHYKKVECGADKDGCHIDLYTDGENTAEVSSVMSGGGWEKEVRERSCWQVKEFKLKMGEKLLLEKRSAYSTDRDLDALTSRQVLKKLSDKSFKELFSAHSRQWGDRWQTCDIRIAGDEESQLQTRVSLYHLLRAHVDDSRVAIGAKGFAGDAYWGHFFWDTEMFMLPFFLYTDPKKAKTLTDFRIGCLEGSKQNAAEYGYRGARFAWQSNTSGKENLTKMLWQYRDNEIHVTGDVVYGLYHYAKATSDEAYLKKDAARTIIEVCRYWMDRIDLRNGKPQILGVMGPDEYNPCTHNNSFTNRLAILCLQLGAGIGPLNGVTGQEVQSWKKTAAEIPIPRRADGLVLQSEDFELLAEPDFARYWPDRSKPYAAVVHQDRNYRSKSSKQPDVLMMMLLFANEFSTGELKAAWDYYEPLCTHDSSLSPGIHGIIALRLGIEDKVWKYWKYTAGLDLNIKKGKASQGIHIACCGATWQMLVFGFAGVRPATEKDILTMEPRLPDKWDKISFPLVWKGQKVEISIDHRQVTLNNKSNTPIKICLYGKQYGISAGKIEDLPYKKT